MQLTIRNVPLELADALKSSAKNLGLSLNKTVVKLLHDSVLKRTEAPLAKKRDLSRFRGIWSPEEAKLINEALKDFEKIDWEMWK